MSLENTLKDIGLDAMAGEVGLLSLHDGDPGGTGTNELSGGAPAYARKTPTWAAASGGSVDLSNSPVFDVPAGATVAHVGFWSADGSTWYGSDPVTNEVYGDQGTYTVNSGSISIS